MRAALVIAAGAAAWLVFRRHKLGHWPTTAKEVFSIGACCAACDKSGTTCGGAVSAPDAVASVLGGEVEINTPAAPAIGLYELPPYDELPTFGTCGA